MDIIKFDGWDLDASSEDEPRVRDVDVASRAGLAQPRDVRRVIEKNWDELSAYGEIRISALGAQFRRGPKGREYWLNEEQATALLAMLKTPLARQLRIALVKLFVAYRRGLLAPVHTVPLDFAHGPRLGDVPNLKADVSALCAMTARACGRSLRQVHGFVRRTYRVPGIHHLSVYVWSAVKQTLEQIALGGITIGPASRPALPPDRRQVAMPWRAN